MKSVICVLLVAVSVFSLEFKRGVQLPPVDGSVFNGSVWVQK